MLFYLRLETRNFTFDAIGRTRDEAICAMREGWEKHRAETGATLTWNDVRDDVSDRELLLGECYRDGELLGRRLL